ncbi:hypothetical protein [Scopulibacillus cellulosilyticus]|uniref:Uncharacterized protein n=1 Tax=Scopulibacillus cellulosilyticus TaxID=2665665 RepID=A0ABW2PRC3_9BACL
MIYVFIVLLFLLGIVSLFYSFSKWTTQRRFAFKNKKMAKEQNIIIVMAAAGIILIIIAWFIYRR